jgi:DivIVA domain-containing protein
MDSSPPNEPANASQAAAKPSIDSLRTVEFRTTLRGYHMDDVDEYLERVAVEAETLQEQVRLASDRVKQANERATSLEQQLEQARRTQQAQAAQAQKNQQASPAQERTERAEATDDSLQRTLLLAQKFVDQTRQESEREASELLASSEARARSIVADAEEHVRVMTQDAERNLREEVKRLDSHRAELVADVETIARHLEAERARIRKALTEMLAWVDEHVQPPKASGSRASGSADPSPSKFRDGVDSLDQGGERSAREDGADRRPDPQPSARQSSEPGATGYASLDKGADAGAGADSGGIGRDGTTGSDGTTGGRTGEDASGGETVRSTRDDVGISGPPTEKIPATSSEGSDLDELEVPDDELAGRPAAGRDRPMPGGSSDRSASSHQRQMFAPGREPRQAGSGVIR